MCIIGLNLDDRLHAAISVMDRVCVHVSVVRRSVLMDYNDMLCV